MAAIVANGGFEAWFTDGGYTGQTYTVSPATGIPGANVSRTTGTSAQSQDTESYRGTYCANDMDIVDKVANDTLGIGIVSAAYADTKKVDILAIKNGTTTNTFPSTNVRQDPGVYPPTCTWPYKRYLYAYTTDIVTPATAAAKISKFCFSGAGATAFKNGPLYKASFWAPNIANWTW
jgi:ABC-type phosphate transport system substrate-binding protein